jgi:MYXO-CTERM domain-containing protein
MALAFRSQVSMLAAAAALSVISRAGVAAAADTVVQVPCEGLLTGRTVATFTGGMVVPWVATQGVDGDGNGDGYVTTAVETELVKQGKTVGGVAGKALPDDGLFPMDARHPAIQLHFSNAADKASPQTLSLHQNNQSIQKFQLPVPAATYSKMFLILTSSEGAGALTITLNYAGGAQPVVTKLTLPDYGVGGANNPNDPVFFNLIAGMRKWGSMLNEGDGPSHTITGIELAPSATDKLTSIGVEKTNGSYVVFWGATGIATSAVEIGVGGGGAGGAAAGGTAGAGGASAGGAGGAPAAGAGGFATAGASTAGGGGASGGTAVTVAGAAGTLPVTGLAGSTTTGTGGSSSAVTPAATSADSGGCTLRGGASDAGGWLVLLMAGGLVLRRRREGVRG